MGRPTADQASRGKPRPNSRACGRHYLRSAILSLSISQIELATGRLHVRRAKNGSPSVHPMQGDEIRALRRLQREQGAVLERLYDRAGRADDAQSIPCAIRPDRRAGQNAVPSPPSHVEARLRLRVGQCRPRHRALQAWAATKTSSTRCATPSWRRIGSRTSGDRRFVAIGVRRPRS
jgi:hypothetical protein